MNIGLCLYYSSFLTDPGFDDLILTFELKKQNQKIFLLIHKYEKWVVTEKKFKLKKNVYIVKKQGLELYRQTDISGSLNVFN